MQEMLEMKQQWHDLALKHLRTLARDEYGVEPDAVDGSELVVSTPPEEKLGDLALPVFPYAKVFRTAPPKIAAQLCERVNPEADKLGLGAAETAGGYLNVRLQRDRLIEPILSAVLEQQSEYGRVHTLDGVRTVVEFSCPNTNKPLHLGHLRNDALGESVSRILKFAGAEVRKVNLINDRGVHICKSMLAYRKLGNGATPESEGVKSDHFVGEYYVRYSRWAAEDPDAEQQAKEMLQRWEQGDPKTVELWLQMNRWAIEGIEETYRRTGVSFDAVYFESETYKAGREEVLKGLERGVFYQAEDGAVWVDLSDIELDQKVLLRSDGTSLYLTQDIGTAIQRHDDWPFERMIYVVASEQNYHFKVLFNVLERLGFEWARNLYHLSYGMVNLPEGKMKSREGTVVDADLLLDKLNEMAVNEIRTKARESEITDLSGTAEKIALGALHYFLLQTSPNKDMIFDPGASLSFNGNTGPYLQYTCARISSIMRKAEAGGATGADSGAYRLPEDAALQLTHPEEWQLVKQLAGFPEAVMQAAEGLNPTIITTYVYDIAKTFSGYYHEVPVLRAGSPAQVQARLALAAAVRQVIANALCLIDVPFLERM